MTQTLDLATVLTTFDVTDGDLDLVLEAGTHLLPHVDAFVHDWYDWLRGHEEFDTFFGDAKELLAHVQKHQKRHWTSFLSGVIDDAYVAARRHVGAVHGRIDLPNVIYLSGMFMSDRLLQERLAAVRPRPERFEAMAAAIERLIFLDTRLVLEQIHDTQKRAAEDAAEENARLEARSEALLEQATPVTPIWEGILLLPLIGVLDSSRTQEIMTKTLSMIAETRTKVHARHQRRPHRRHRGREPARQDHPGDAPRAPSPLRWWRPPPARTTWAASPPRRSRSGSSPRTPDPSTTPPAWWRGGGRERR